MRAMLRERRAGVALVFALTLIPVLGLIGLAVDFGFVSQAKSQLNLAANSAAMSATMTAAEAFTANQPNYIAQGQAAGQQWFAAQTGTVANTAVKSPTVTVVQNGGLFTGTVSYTASLPTFLGRLFGVSTVSMGGSSTASMPTKSYVSVNFLLDNSSSMLLAATPSGISTMNNATSSLTPAQQSQVPDGLGGLKCSFACHWTSSNAGYPQLVSADYYGLARSYGVQLRFDVLKQATQTAIQTMISDELIANQFSVTVDTFNTTLTQVYPTSQSQTSTTDLADAYAAVDAVQSPVTPDQANTWFPTIMTQLANSTTAAGDGSSAASPKKALIIVTDGMADYGSRSIPTTEGPLDPANCSAMKAKGYSIYVLYTPYSSDPTVLVFGNSALAPYLNGTASPGMVASLQACASSPNDFAQASDTTTIIADMNQMVQSALGAGGRFTQ